MSILTALDKVDSHHGLKIVIISLWFPLYGAVIAFLKYVSIPDVFIIKYAPSSSIFSKFCASSFNLIDTFPLSLPSFAVIVFTPETISSSFTFNLIFPVSFCIPLILTVFSSVSLIPYNVYARTLNVTFLCPNKISAGICIK